MQEKAITDYEERNAWDPLVLETDKTLIVLPEGTTPEPTPVPTFILPASVTTIESGAFAGITGQIFRIPATVTCIADDAFDPFTFVIVQEGSYADSRCRELGIKVYR